MEPIYKEFIISLNLAIKVAWIASVYLLKNIKQYLFVKLRYKDPSVLSLEWVLNAMCSLLLTRMTYLLYSYPYPAIDSDEKYFYTRLTVEIDGYQPSLGLQITFASLLAISSIRTFLIFKASRTFGPIIEIIITMLNEVRKFAMIQGVFIMIFFGSMRIMYYRYPEFSTEREAFATLFAASLRF
jgi:hypothetical protein